MSGEEQNVSELTRSVMTSGHIARLRDERLQLT